MIQSAASGLQGIAVMSHYITWIIITLLICACMWTCVYVGMWSRLVLQLFVSLLVCLKYWLATAATTTAAATTEEYQKQLRITSTCLERNGLKRKKKRKLFRCSVGLVILCIRVRVCIHRHRHVLASHVVWLTVVVVVVVVRLQQGMGRHGSNWAVILQDPDFAEIVS